MVVGVVEFPLTTRVALRHQLRRRDESAEGAEEIRHYARLLVNMEIPTEDPYIQALQSLAARTTGAIPIVRRVEPMILTMDVPISLDARRELKRKVQALPFVVGVTLSTGPKIR